MRKTYAAALVAFAVAFAPAGVANAAVPDVLGIGDSYIVVFNDSVDSTQVATEQAGRFGLTVGNTFHSALQGFSARMPAVVADLLAQDPRVAYVQKDEVVQISAQTVPTGVNRADADASPTANINGTDERVDVDVAVIDTGADLTHPDLNVYTAGKKSCGLLNILSGARDGHGHGTHVSGTIGALDNGDGVVGMAPGARIWPVKVLSDSGFGLTSDIVCGIDYVTAHADEIEVANMSLGGAGADDGNCGNTDGDAQHQAICRAVAAGITFVVAAGNDAADSAGSVPASYDEVITVSALADFDGVPGGAAASTCRADQDDTIADFSNYGADVDIIAPGTCILSTWKQGGYSTISGTSMASPHVAGAAALYKATHPGASPADVKAALVAAGTTDYGWPAQDPDGVQEPLLNVATF